MEIQLILLFHRQIQFSPLGLNIFNEHNFFHLNNQDKLIRNLGRHPADSVYKKYQQNEKKKKLHKRKIISNFLCSLVESHHACIWRLPVYHNQIADCSPELMGKFMPHVDSGIKVTCEEFIYFLQNWSHMLLLHQKYNARMSRTNLLLWKKFLNKFDKSI